MADNWVRVANTTIANYIRQEEINVLRARKLLAMLQSRGRVTMNHSGTEMDWKVRYRQSPMSGYADGDMLSFPRQNRHKTAKLPWRGYTATDSISKMEIEQNKGAEAIIKLIDNLAKFLMSDMSEQFGQQLYVDGNASGYTKGIHGLESFFGLTGTPAADGYVGVPSDTYAELNTGLGYYGGSWDLNSSNSMWPRARARPSTTSGRRWSWTTPTPPGRRPPRRGRTPASRSCGSPSRTPAGTRT
jgi:hypothetical protein